MNDVCMKSIFFLKRSAFIVAVFWGARHLAAVVSPSGRVLCRVSGRPLGLTPPDASVPDGSMARVGRWCGQAGTGGYAQGGQVVLRCSRERLDHQP